MVTNGQGTSSSGASGYLLSFVAGLLGAVGGAMAGGYIGGVLAEQTLTGWHGVGTGIVYGIVGAYAGFAAGGVLTLLGALRLRRLPAAELTAAVFFILVAGVAVMEIFIIGKTPSPAWGALPVLPVAARIAALALIRFSPAPQA